jgi:phospholipid-binding lipoprotein MlaA
VIPFLGPSTLRDGIGFVGDYGTSYVINVAQLYRGNLAWGLGALSAVDQRSNVSFRYYSTGSPFEYDNIRFLYVRKRLIEDQGVRAKDPRKGPKSTPQQENKGDQPAGK